MKNQKLYFMGEALRAARIKMIFLVASLAVLIFFLVTCWSDRSQMMVFVSIPVVCTSSLVSKEILIRERLLISAVAFGISSFAFYLWEFHRAHTPLDHSFGRWAYVLGVAIVFIALQIGRVGSSRRS